MGVEFCARIAPKIRKPAKLMIAAQVGKLE